MRGLVARNIGALECDLVLIDKERFIPNSAGTRGFIDLLARDGADNLVLGELKCSDAAARESIHEVLKDVEGAEAISGSKRRRN